MSLCPFSSSTSNMALGSAWVTAASITTASSLAGSPLVTLSLRARAGRRGPRRGVDDLANSQTVYRSFVREDSLPLAGRLKKDPSLPSPQGPARGREFD